MKKFFKRFAGISLVLVMLLSMTAVGFAAEKTITVLQTSDIHGNIYPWAYKTGEHDDDVGLAKVNSIVKQVKEENPNTLLIDSGDNIQGSTLTAIYKDKEDVVHPMMKTMNFMGYDAMVLGNHEFNHGLPTLKRIMNDAKFPILSSNISYKDDGTLFAKPYVIKEVDGVKVGILGLTTPNIPRWDGDKVAELQFDGMSETAQKYVPELKEKGADVIIGLAHAGIEGRHHPTGGDKVGKVAKENPDIDIIVTGHDHHEVNTTINDTLIAAPEDKGHQVVRIDLELNKENGKWVIANKQARHYETYKVEADEDVLEVAKKYHEATQEYVNTPIGTATGDFVPEDAVRGVPTAQIQDTALMDLINRVQMKYTGADISSAALFEWGSNIEEGPVSIKDAARIYKYTNTLYAVEVTGKELKEYMEWSAAYYNTYKSGDVTISFDPDIRGYNYDMFAGVEYKIDISKPAGERITDLTYNGKPVRDDQTFTLALNNYRYSGLKSEGMISNDPVYKSDKMIRTMISDYIDEKGEIKPKVDNNWKVVGADLDHWAKAEAIELLNDGILQIPSKNRSWNGASLNLKEEANRDTLVKALVRMFNYQVPAEVEEPSYSDVEGDVARYAEAALKAGLKPGRTESTFGPTDIITREEAAAMLVRALRVKVDGNISVLKDYTDADKISDKYRDEVATAIEMGLISGRDVNEFSPKAEMTMGGLASMLHNYKAKYKQLDVLTTNDFHGKVKAGYEAGAAKLAAMIKHYRSANPEGTILLDGGDAYQGTPISGLNQGKPVIEVYNHLGYTAQAVGNHEFDWGVETLKEIGQQTEFPFLAANLYNKNTGKQVSWADEYMMKEVDGVKIGIIGISTPDTKGTTMPSNVAHLEFKDPASVIQEIAPQLREKGAEMVLVVSHMPGTMDYDSGELAGELIETAKKVDVDGIIGGHSHHTVTGIVNGVSVVEAYKHGRELGNLRYYVNKTTDKIYQAKPMSHSVRKTKMQIRPDKKVQAMVEKYQKELAPKMNEVLTTSKVELKRSYNDISNIGSLITGVMQEEADVDVAFQNPGGIRVDLPAGEVTVGDWYEVLPFGNTIVTAEMTGAQIIKVLEQSFTLEKGMMQLAGLKVEYDSSKPEYNRVVEVRFADGTKLQKDKTYTVATNNFLAEGGDGYSTFKEVEFTNTFKKVRSAVIEYLRKQDSISPEVDDRVIDLNKQAAAYSLNPAA